MNEVERQPARGWRIAPVLALVAGLAVAVAAGYGLRAFTADGNAAAAAPAAAASAPEPSVSVVDGRTVVTLDPAVQARSGLRTEMLTAAPYRHETPAYAQAMDLQPLIDLRTRYAAAVAEQVSAAAAAQAASADEARSAALYRDGRNVSQQVFETAQAAARAQRARDRAAARTVDDLRGAMRTGFGDTLAGWLLDPASPAWQRLLQRRDVLLRVTQPPGAAGSAPPRIEVDAVPGTGRRMPATFVARATQGDPAVPGEVWIYRAAGPIAGGTRLDAYLPAAAPAAVGGSAHTSAASGSAPAAAGVVVPTAATVWYAGQTWAYVQTAADRFARVPVPADAPVAGGQYVAGGIAPGAKVVVQGAQLLLSEELKPRAAGSACKDPECD